MVASCGSCLRSSFSTVRPPTPESNTPIGRALRSATRGYCAAARSSIAAPLLALLRDERVREGFDRLAHGRGRARQDERVLLVDRLGDQLPIGRDLADDRQVERVFEAALRHARRGVGLVHDEEDRLLALVAEGLERV